MSWFWFQAYSESQAVMSVLFQSKVESFRNQFWFRFRNRNRASLVATSQTSSVILCMHYYVVLSECEASSLQWIPSHSLKQGGLRSLSPVTLQLGTGRYHILAEMPILAFADTAGTRILDLADCKKQGSNFFAYGRISAPQEAHLGGQLVRGEWVEVSLELLALQKCFTYQNLQDFIRKWMGIFSTLHLYYK